MGWWGLTDTDVITIVLFSELIAAFFLLDKGRKILLGFKKNEC